MKNLKLTKLFVTSKRLRISISFFTKTFEKLSDCKKKNVIVEQILYNNHSIFLKPSSMEPYMREKLTNTKKSLVKLVKMDWFSEVSSRKNLTKNTLTAAKCYHLVCCNFSPTCLQKTQWWKWKRKLVKSAV